MEQSETQLEKRELERIKLLYDNARFSIAGVFISTFFFTIFLWNNIPRPVWLIWILSIVLINFPRFYLVHIFHRRLQFDDIKLGDISRWENRLFLGVVFSSLSWGAVGLFPFHSEQQSSLVFAALILVGMCSTSIVTMISSLKMGLTFITIALMPLTARALLAGEIPLFILAVILLTYYAIFTQLACRLHYTIIDNIHLKFENEELSLRDTLTGLWNRRQLSLFIEQLRSRAERNGETFSVILMDLDYFKNYNDSKGHNAGDSLLSKAADIISHESRDVDLAVRYGGEEFLVVLPRAGVEQAAQLAERIRTSIERETEVTLSAGIAGYTEKESFEKMMAKADEALYQAKYRGRNRVVLYSEETAKVV